jgi:cell division protein FtsB
MLLDRRSWFKKLLTNPKIISIIGLVIIAFIGWPLITNIKKRYYVNQEVKLLNSEIAEIESENLKLKEMIDYLNSDAFIEEQSRLNFGLKKAGEKVVILPKADLTATGSFSGQNVYSIGNADERSNATRWWNYFFP